MADQIAEVPVQQPTLEEEISNLQHIIAAQAAQIEALEAAVFPPAGTAMSGSTDASATLTDGTAVTFAELVQAVEAAGIRPRK